MILQKPKESSMSKFKVGQVVDVTNNGCYGGFTNISDTGTVVRVIAEDEYEVEVLVSSTATPEHYPYFFIESELKEIK